MKSTTLRFSRTTRVRSAAIALVVLQSVASYGYAEIHDINEYVEVHAEPIAAPSDEISQQIRAEIEVTIAALNAENMARLSERIRLSTRELLAAAAPTDDVATMPLQASAKTR